jgi:hypothetical protein
MILTVFKFSSTHSKLKTGHRDIHMASPADVLARVASLIRTSSYKAAALALQELEPRPHTAIAACRLAALHRRGTDLKFENEFRASVADIFARMRGEDTDATISARQAGGVGTRLALLAEIANWPWDPRDPVGASMSFLDQMHDSLHAALHDSLDAALHAGAPAPEFEYAARGIGMPCAGDAFTDGHPDLAFPWIAGVTTFSARRLVADRRVAGLPIDGGDTPLEDLAATMTWNGAPIDCAFERIAGFRPASRHMTTIFAALKELAGRDSYFDQWTAAVGAILADIQTSDALDMDGRFDMLDQLLAFALAFLIRVSNHPGASIWCLTMTWVRAWLLPDIAAALAECSPRPLVLSTVII